MTRAVVFLFAAMAAASLGVVAQDVSGGGTNSAPPGTASQSNNSNNNSQQSAQQPASTSTAASTDNGSVRSSAPSNGGANLQGTAQGETAAANNGQLPQTSTILPLLGLIGLGSLVAGFFARH